MPNQLESSGIYCRGGGGRAAPMSEATQNCAIFGVQFQSTNRFVGMNFLDYFAR